MLVENLVLDMLHEILKAQQDNNRLLNTISKQLSTQESDVMATLDSLQADVHANGDVVASAVTLLKGLKDALDAAGTDATKLAELSATLEANTASLAGAVAANTPAGPPTQPTTPEPAPTP